MINYTWLAERLDAYPEKDGFKDVVFTVCWRVNAVDGEYFSTSFGNQPIALNTSDQFTPYADLTQSQVIDWVKTAMEPPRVAEIENGLANQIAYQKNPPVISPVLPWATA